jgi:hypothetical protein
LVDQLKEVAHNGNSKSQFDNALSLMESHLVASQQIQILNESLYDQVKKLVRYCNNVIGIGS